MTTLSGGEAWTFVEGWIEQKSRSNSQHICPADILHKIIKIRHQWLLTVFTWFLEAQKLEPTSMSGLANMSGAWDLGPHVNQPLFATLA